MKSVPVKKKKKKKKAEPLYGADFAPAPSTRCYHFTTGAYFEASINNSSGRMTFGQLLVAQELWGIRLFFLQDSHCGSGPDEFYPLGHPARAHPLRRKYPYSWVCRVHPESFAADLAYEAVTKVRLFTPVCPHNKEDPYVF